MPNLRLTKEPQYALLDWARKPCGVSGSIWPRDSEAMGVVEAESGRVRAVVVFNGYTGDAIMAHIASDGTRGWASRNILGGLFGYAFEFKGVDRMHLAIPATNRAAQITAIKLGFRFEGIARGAMGEREDAITFGMLREECPWIIDTPDDEEPDHG